MSSRVIRGADRVHRLKVTDLNGPAGAGLPQDHVMNVEKQAFEQGFREGERMGKQMGEKMVESVLRRYERAIVELAASHRSLTRSMEVEGVKLAIEIARKIVQRELRTDPDLILALTSLALRRVQDQQSIKLRVSRHDFERVRTGTEHVNASVQVIEDSSLERGDFIIDTDQTHLDGRLQLEIDKISRALLET